MKYNESFKFDTTGNGFIRFKLNDMTGIHEDLGSYTTVSGSTTRQPYYWDQLSPLYHRYLVVASEWKFTIVSHGAEEFRLFTQALKGALPAIGAGADLMQASGLWRNRTVYPTLATAKNNTVMILKFDHARVAECTKSAYITQSAASLLTNEFGGNAMAEGSETAPSTKLYLSLENHTGADTTSAMKFSLYVEAKFHVVMHNKSTTAIAES